MRRNSLFWGLVIIVAGIFLLLDNLGVLNVNVWGLIWPAAIIVLGIWFIWGRLSKSPEAVMQELTIPLENATSASVTIKHGAGRLQLHGGSSPIDLLSGSFTGGVIQTTNRIGNQIQVEMHPPSDQPWNTLDKEGFKWDVSFNETLPINFSLQTGASESQIDLSQLKVDNFKLETGASSTQITMPAIAGMTHAQIKSGVSGVKIIIPQGVAAQIHVTSGLAGIHIDENRFPRFGNDYRSSDYDNASNRLDLSIETGVGDVDVL